MSDSSRQGASVPAKSALPGFGVAEEAYFGTVGSQIADLIRRDIQEGALRPGERLRQREVAERFKISTTPVREAFWALQAEGFLRVHPHRGAIVVEPLAADIWEAYEIRKALEGLATANAIAHMTPADRRSLRRVLKRMEVTSDRRIWARLDQEFHLQIYQLARMPRLEQMVARLRAAFSYYAESAYDDSRRRAEAMDDHRRILIACLRGDEAEARAATEEHLEHTAQVVRASLDSATTQSA